jgi:hypothetical protein
MTLQEALKKIRSTGLSYVEIQRLLESRKVKTTTATLSRLGGGKVKTSNGYELSEELVKMARKINL